MKFMNSSEKKRLDKKTARIIVSIHPDIWIQEVTMNTKKTIKDISLVKKTTEGVMIEITSRDEMDLKAVQGMVESCATGACDCMKPETKVKVKGMEFKTVQGQSAIYINGDLSVAEIHETMDRSTKEVGCCTISETGGSACCS